VDKKRWTAPHEKEASLRNFVSPYVDGCSEGKWSVNCSVFLLGLYDVDFFYVVVDIESCGNFQLIGCHGPQILSQFGF